MNGHLIFYQGLTCPVGFRHPPEQLPSGDITKVCRETISAKFLIVMPSPTTLASRHINSIIFFSLLEGGGLQGGLLDKYLSEARIYKQRVNLSGNFWEPKKKKNSTPRGCQFGAFSASDSLGLTTPFL